MATLSTQLSTAALDKHPQSKERGITLDLGFSSFITDTLPPQLEPKDYYTGLQVCTSAKLMRQEAGPSRHHLACMCWHDAIMHASASSCEMCNAEQC